MVVPLTPTCADLLDLALFPRSFRGGAKAPNPESKLVPRLEEVEAWIPGSRWRAPRND
jgi:hypothetical protein